MTSVIGAELLHKQSEAVRLSRNVWSFDAECIEDDDDDAVVLGEFAALTGKEAQVAQIKSSIDGDV
ncbi:hypothetical protein [Saccharibacillus alkalitolerans]|uniref:Uncharacterized protein n=1 Tax=Saccharibacillus alkalitolerans TaxID=2705290 RepID=A0ABX0F7H6_9BACL|nr:hypothetical protein [Saccharibacillus alkalitolerans]NGZ76913.1 hypothetical protein [Saccharibacillus alkalitolerans]